MTRLTNIAIHHPGPSVEIGFEWDEVIRYNETVLWSLFARDQRDQTRQFGYKLIGDKPVQFVFNHNRGLQSNTPVSASLGFREGYLRVRFPLWSATGMDLAALVHTHGNLNIDGHDVSQRQLLSP